MPTNVKPSLSPNGWVTSAPLKLDDLMADFYYSEYSQSAIYMGHVASLPYIVQNNQNDPYGTANATEQTLLSYLGRYFNSVTVRCTAKYDNPVPNQAAITIFVEVTDQDGKMHTISDLLYFLDSKFQQVIKLNNAE